MHSHLMFRETKWLDNTSSKSHRGLPFLTSSQIKYFTSTSPDAYHKKYISKQVPEMETKDAMIFGTVFHMCLLEPENFREQVHLCTIDQRTKEFKDWKKSLLGWDEIERNKNGTHTAVDGREIFIVKDDTFTSCIEMAKRVQEHPLASQLIVNGTYEQTGVAYDASLNMQYAIRSDCRGMYNNGERYFLDVKTCADLNFQSISNSMMNYGYDLQAEHYLHTGNLIDGGYENFYFLFICKNPPYECALIRMDEKTRHLSNQRYHKILKRIANCYQNNSWPTLDNGNEILFTLPEWHFYT